MLERERGRPRLTRLRLGMETEDIRQEQRTTEGSAPLIWSCQQASSPGLAEESSRVST